MACSRVLVVEDDPYWQRLLLETVGRCPKERMIDGNDASYDSGCRR